MITAVKPSRETFFWKNKPFFFSPLLFFGVVAAAAAVMMEMSWSHSSRCHSALLLIFTAADQSQLQYHRY